MLPLAEIHRPLVLEGGNVWNAFETRGRCPLCNYQWEETACPSAVKCRVMAEWRINSVNCEMLSKLASKRRRRKNRFIIRMLRPGIDNAEYLSSFALSQKRR